MSTESRHLSVHIDRPLAEVYAFAADPANLPRWAPGLGSAVVQEDGQWTSRRPRPHHVRPAQRVRRTRSRGGDADRRDGLPPRTRDRRQ
ncbi:MAG TPA: SRPBCC family protein [Mycobacteriales bacterium]|nr:SRPBCC family protein [Mycobacteriales bacterium]